MQLPRKCRRRDLVATETVLQAVTELNQLNSPFSQLPGESRNAIYQYVLGGRDLCTTFRKGKANSVGRPASLDWALDLDNLSKILVVHLQLHVV
jgi:hypothetical protein